MSSNPTRITRRNLLLDTSSIGINLLAANLVLASTHRKSMVARIFFESFCANALRSAQRYAGKEGYVASIPHLLHARGQASYENIIWNTWFFSSSEESVVVTPKGNPVVVTVHGQGFLSDPDRIEQAVRADLNRYNEHGLTGQYAVKITQSEAKNLLDGKSPAGNDLPLFSYQEFRDYGGILPRNYGVILDFEIAKKSGNGYIDFDVLRKDPLMICRSGGEDAANAYLDRFMERNNTKKMLFAHKLNNIEPSQPQTRLISLGGNSGGTGSEGHDGLDWGYGEDWGLAATGPVDMGRYVGVAPRDIQNSLQFLKFES